MVLQGVLSGQQLHPSVTHYEPHTSTRKSCQCIARVPPGPAPPCIFLAALSTCADVTSMSIKGGSSSHVRNALSVASLGSGCFSFSTSKTVLPAAFTVALGSRIPPLDGLSVIHRTADRTQPCSINCIKTLIVCSSSSSFPLGASEAGGHTFHARKNTASIAADEDP